MSPEDGRERCGRAARSLLGVQPLYIKTDSTLRGQIGATFRGVLDAFPGRRIVYTPAYPSLGRTVVRGVLYVDGVPVAKTAFARDPRFAVCESSIRQLLAGLPVDVCDARTDDDLAAIAHRVLEAEGTIAAGSGGLARHWATRLGGPEKAARERTVVRRWLLVCGSLHPASLAQAERARALGIDVIATGSDAAGDPTGIARELAARAVAAVVRDWFDGPIVFGGDTTRAVLHALGCTQLMPVREVAPGVPVSIAFTPERQLTLVTKARFRQREHSRVHHRRAEAGNMIFGITQGDSSGVGPEILLKAARDGHIQAPFVVFGDLAVLEGCDRVLGCGLRLRSAGRPADVQDGWVNVIDHRLLREEDVRPGEISAASGNAAREYVVSATRAALAGDIAAIVTLPMNKEATQLSDPKFTGHTELIGEICGATDVTIMLASEQLIVTHVSTHCCLREAIERAKRQRIETIINLTCDAVARIRGPEARVAVAGLNPHAGENGLFGREDIDEIQPAVAAARSRGLPVDGPLPPDAVFYLTVRRRKYAAVVCMYHDQGHIPSKLLDFEGGVNVTLGLPIIRTSVDHGTAFDIAWKGVASTTSFVKAFDFAARLATAPVAPGGKS